jgi:hypothetical protein
MTKLSFWALAFAGASFVSTCNAQGFASVFYSYNPGTGFSTGFTNPAVSLGQPTLTATPFSPAFRNTQIVSLGAGGSLVVGFSSPIHNDPAHPFGLDFNIYGNAGFIITNGDFSGGGITDGSLLGNNAGSTRVSVSADNLTWYQLNPSLAPVVDGLYPTDGTGDFGVPMNPGFGQGAFNGKNLAGIRSIYGGSAGGGSFDISWAMDSMGNPVILDEINFVRVDVLTGKSEIDGFSLVAVPEPRTCGLFLLFLAALGWGRRRVLRAGAAAFAFFAAVSIAGAGVITQDFSSNPATNGWQSFGNTNFFVWDSTNQNLNVTWDSSKSNSYFYHSLERTLTRNDDYSLSFDIRLDDVGPADDLLYSFEFGIGLLDIDNAKQPGFLRGTGFDAPNVAEIAYFRHDMFGGPDTLYPTFIGSDNTFNYNPGGTDSTNYTLTPGEWHHLSLTFTASNQIAVMTVVNAASNHTGTVVQLLNTSFTDYQVNAFSISSYSDAGQFPDFAGSILAHGRMDNLVINIPPPAQNLTGAFSNDTWQVQFNNRPNWVYTLERSIDFQSWSNASVTLPGNGALLTLQDTNSVSGKAFYRVRADRP